MSQTLVVVSQAYLIRLMVITRAFKLAIRHERKSLYIDRVSRQTTLSGLAGLISLSDRVSSATRR